MRQQNLVRDLWRLLRMNSQVFLTSAVEAEVAEKDQKDWDFKDIDDPEEIEQVVAKRARSLKPFPKRSNWQPGWTVNNL